MAQLDALIILPLILGLLISLVLHYKYLLELGIPGFFGVKKFRKKKLSSSLLKFSGAKGVSKAYIV